MALKRTTGCAPCGSLSAIGERVARRWIVTGHGAAASRGAVAPATATARMELMARSRRYDVRPMSKKRPRTERRERERALEKLARDRARLAALEPGGSAERPIELESASQVEPHARSLRCTRCEAEMRVEEHVARTVGEHRLRLARLVCPRCGTRREAWFCLAPELPS